MTEINEVALTAEDDDLDIEEYHERIQALLYTIEGTLPGSRGFGIPLRFISNPPNVIANMLAAELAGKFEEFMPELRLIGITTQGTIDGDIDVTIHVGRRTR